MSHAASMNLLSFDVLRVSGPVDTRLKWALAGSVAVHVTFAAMAIIRFMPMLERPVAPYHVALVTLADIQPSPAPVPESHPRPVPTAKPREPERITNSLVGDLESVVVPGPRNVEAAKHIEPVLTPPPPQPAAREPDVPRVQALPTPPQLDSGPSGIPSTRPAPMTKDVSLAQTLKQAVAAVVVPLKSSRPPSAESPPSQKDNAPVHAPKAGRPASRSGESPEFKHFQETLAENGPVVKPLPAPTLARIEQARPTVAKTPVSPDDDGPENVAIDTLPIPKVKHLRSHRLNPRQTAGGTQTLTSLLPGGESDSETEKYWAQVWSRIDGEWVAPPVAIRQQDPLHVVLAIRVEQTGQVREQSVDFVEKSGNAYYDSAAKRAVVSASPLPRFPPHMTEPYYDFKFRFTFKPDK